MYEQGVWYNSIITGGGMECEANSDSFLVYSYTVVSLSWGNTQIIMAQFSSVAHVWLFVTPWTAICQASLSITNFWNLLKFMSIELAEGSLIL